MATNQYEKLAIVALRNAVEAVRVAASVCIAADFGRVHVLDPLEQIEADLREVLKVAEGKA